jgi:hypothetical protein
MVLFPIQFQDNFMKQDIQSNKKILKEAAWWLSRWISGSMRDPDWIDDWTTFNLDHAFDVLSATVGNKHSANGKSLWRGIVVPEYIAETIEQEKRLPVNAFNRFQSFSRSRDIAEEFVMECYLEPSSVRILVEACPDPHIVKFGMADLKASKRSEIQDVLLQLMDWHHQDEVIVDIQTSLPLLTVCRLDTPKYRF